VSDVPVLLSWVLMIAQWYNFHSCTAAAFSPDDLICLRSDLLLLDGCSGAPSRMVD
jgi:hypothetical protein